MAQPAQPGPGTPAPTTRPTSYWLTLLIVIAVLFVIVTVLWALMKAQIGYYPPQPAPTMSTPRTAYLIR